MQIVSFLLVALRTSPGEVRVAILAMGRRKGESLEVIPFKEKKAEKRHFGTWLDIGTKIILCGKNRQLSVCQAESVYFTLFAIRIIYDKS
jgi:hypothetical protein